MQENSMVSVVIPTLNEAGTISDIIKTIKETIAYPYEIIIVDGGSTDNTREIVQKEKCKLIVEPRRGYGIALRTGIAHARGDIILIVDGDGTYEVRDLNRLISALYHENADLCLGARIYNLSDKSMDVINYIGNKIITFAFNVLYNQNLWDSQSGFRAIKRSALNKVHLKENDMAFATEMLVAFAKKGLKIIERPTTYKLRVYGKSKLRRVKAGLEIFKVLLKGVLER